MIDHYFLALTIVIAGLLGGVINYFMVHVKEEEFSNMYIFLKSVFLGLGASALIPLFLSLIGSKLLEPVFSAKGYPYLNYYVIGGFCLAGSIYSKRFIEDVYSRITKAEGVAIAAKKTAEEAKKTTNEIELSVTETDHPPEILNHQALNQNPSDTKTKNFQLIIHALLESRYVYRTLTGISKETGIDKSMLKDYLDEMIASGLVTSKVNKNESRVFKAVI
jgi:DNA-binding MarR family transcriptional regulator